MTREELKEKLCPTDATCGCEDCGSICKNCDELLNAMLDEYEKKIRADVIEEVLKLPRNEYKIYEHGFVENEEAIFVSDILDLKEQKCLI